MVIIIADVPPRDRICPAFFRSPTPLSPESALVQARDALAKCDIWKTLLVGTLFPKPDFRKLACNVASKWTEQFARERSTTSKNSFSTTISAHATYFLLDITYFDLDGVHDGRAAQNQDGMSRHLTAFHRWHNDDRVNAAWGERGDLATRRAYIERQLADSHALLCMMSWDGELTGYVENVYTTENHVAQHYPSYVVPGFWERGWRPRLSGRVEVFRG